MIWFRRAAHIPSKKVEGGQTPFAKSSQRNQAMRFLSKRADFRQTSGAPRASHELRREEQGQVEGASQAMRSHTLLAIVYISRHSRLGTCQQVMYAHTSLEWWQPEWVPAILNPKQTHQEAIHSESHACPNNSGNLLCTSVLHSWNF